MGKLVWDSFSGVRGLKTALVKIRTVLSHSEAVQRENTRTLCQHEERQPQGEVTAALPRVASDKSSGSCTKAPSIQAVSRCVGGQAA